MVEHNELVTEALWDAGETVLEINPMDAVVTETGSGEYELEWSVVDKLSIEDLEKLNEGYTYTDPDSGETVTIQLTEISSSFVIFEVV